MVVVVDLFLLPLAQKYFVFEDWSSWDPVKSLSDRLPGVLRNSVMSQVGNFS